MDAGEEREPDRRERDAEPRRRADAGAEEREREQRRQHDVHPGDEARRSRRVVRSSPGVCSDVPGAEQPPAERRAAAPARPERARARARQGERRAAIAKRSARNGNSG